MSLRQHRVPPQLQGGVNSAYVVLSVGGAAVGSLLGGVLVHAAGLTAPMWFGAAVVALVFAAAVRALRPAAVQLGSDPD